MKLTFFFCIIVIDDTVDEIKVNLTNLNTRLDGNLSSLRMADSGIHKFFM